MVIVANFARCPLKIYDGAGIQTVGRITAVFIKIDEKARRSAKVF